MIRQAQVKELPQPVYVLVWIPDLDDVLRLAEELHRNGVEYRGQYKKIGRLSITLLIPKNQKRKGWFQQS